MFSDNIYVGLDIGQDAVKMVEMSHSKGVLDLQTYGIARHSLALDGYWDSIRLRQLARIIEDIMDSGDFTGVKTVMSVQSRHVFVTTMDFDLNLDRKGIQKEIQKQAPYFLPYPPDEMRLSWSLIENDPRIKSYTGKQRVIINALPDFVIENSKNLLEHVNLDGAALENQSISQIRAILGGDTGNTVLLDLGSNQTTFNIIVDGVLRSSTHVPIGTSTINKELQDQLGIDAATSEYLKKDFGVVNLNELPKPLENSFKILHQELTTFVELNRKVAQTPEKIILTGGGVYTAGLMHYFKGFTIPMYIANPLKQVTVSDDFLPYIQPVSNQLSTALGLALRSDV
jgi:type IV pilus assembly protein PilM